VASGRTDPLPPQDHGGNLAEVLARYGLERVLDFSVSVHPLGPPDGLREHLASRPEDITRYPDRRCEALRAAASSRFGFPPECFLAGNGSAELIDLVLRASPYSRLVISPPDFGLYDALSPRGLPVHRVPRDARADYGIAVERLVEAVLPGDLVLFSNPGNPSGAAVSAEHLAALHDRCAEAGALLVVDEAFVDFCPEVSLLDRVAGSAALVVLRSLTKFYAIPGLRVGFLAGPPERVDRFAALQVPWSVSGPAQAAGTYCLARPAWDRLARDFVARERERTSLALATIPGIEPLPSRANYLLLRLAPPAPGATTLYDSLARRGILVRHCGSFGLGDEYVRIGLRTPEENDRLVAALREASASARGEVP
jgi:threonine-phosphate decarboxylase